MPQLPLPAHAHYEVLLRLLETQTFPAVEEHDYANRQRLQELINGLRKAFSQQRRLETEWQQRGLAIDYRWSAEMGMESLQPQESDSASS